jgi:Leucine-rich repeat (LRR) protein
MTATANQITELEDGVFDGLSSLRRIELQHNRIASIGLHVFTMANLTSIEFIDMTNNSLTHLDKWPMILATRYHTIGKRIRFTFGNNRISEFTNYFKWQFNCSETEFYMRLNVRFNEIKHVMDLMKGWDLTVEEFSCMTSFRQFNQNKPVLALTLFGNPLDCNCIDYPLYKQEKRPFYEHEHVRIYKGTTCVSPPELQNKTVKYIGLDDFVCSISDQCPGNCRCYYRPSNRSLHVNCSHSFLSQVPQYLPPLADSSDKYHLDLSNNPQLTELVSHSYFENISVIDASNCAIADINSTTWRSLFNISIVTLSGNKIKSLPLDVESFNLSTQQLSLGNNPWDCSCDNAWVSTWLNASKQQLLNLHEVICISPENIRGRSLIQVSDNEICPGIIERFHPLWMFLYILLNLAISLIRPQTPQSVFHEQLLSEPFDQDNCNGEIMTYDVFLSCSSADESIAEDVIEYLEAQGYKVCTYNTDCQNGYPFLDFLSKAVMESRRTLCLISDNFINRYFKQLSHYSLSSNKVLYHSCRSPQIMAFCSKSSIYERQLFRNGYWNARMHLTVMQKADRLDY